MKLRLFIKETFLIPMLNAFLLFLPTLYIIRKRKKRRRDKSKGEDIPVYLSLLPQVYLAHTDAVISTYATTAAVLYSQKGVSCMRVAYR